MTNQTGRKPRQNQKPAQPQLAEPQNPLINADVTTGDDAPETNVSSDAQQPPVADQNEAAAQPDPQPPVTNDSPDVGLPRGLQAPVIIADESPHVPAEAVPTTPMTIDEYLTSIGMVEAPQYPEPFFSWVRTMREYEREMMPSVPSSTQTQAKQQRALYTLILSILNSPTNVAVQGMTLILFWINLHKGGMFRPEYVFRSAGARMNAQETILFQEMVTLFIAAAEPATRKLVTKQFTLGRILGGLPTPTAQENFGFFFGG